MTISPVQDEMKITSSFCNFGKTPKTTEKKLSAWLQVGVSSAEFNSFLKAGFDHKAAKNAEVGAYREASETHFPQMVPIDADTKSDTENYKLP